jgi:hypothetical protein
METLEKNDLFGLDITYVQVWDILSGYISGGDLVVFVVAFICVCFWLIGSISAGVYAMARARGQCNMSHYLASPTHQDLDCQPCM